MCNEEWPAQKSALLKIQLNTSTTSLFGQYTAVACFAASSVFLKNKSHLQHRQTHLWLITNNNDYSCAVQPNLPKRRNNYFSKICQPYSAVGSVAKCPPELSVINPYSARRYRRVARNARSKNDHTQHPPPTVH